MKPIITTAICLLGTALLAPRLCVAQFYPDSLANWCFSCTASPAEGCAMHMLQDPDTTIQGIVYKRIEHFPLTGLVFSPGGRRYVRSAPDGKGYIYLPQMDEEYLTGDLNASVGDTVINVAIWDESFTCGNQIIVSPNIVLVDVLVLSIDIISAEGITVVRHSVWPICPGTTTPTFWQKGMGTEHGPISILSPPLAVISLEYASVGDTCYYNTLSDPQGLPGVGACCVYMTNAIDEPAHELPYMHVYPNPSSGLLNVDLSMWAGNGLIDLFVLDAMGRIVASANTGNGKAIFNLSGRSGLFMILAESGGIRSSTRILIE